MGSLGSRGAPASFPFGAASAPAAGPPVSAPATGGAVSAPPGGPAPAGMHGGGSVGGHPGGGHGTVGGHACALGASLYVGAVAAPPMVPPVVGPVVAPPAAMADPEPPTPPSPREAFRAPSCVKNV